MGQVSVSVDGCLSPGLSHGNAMASAAAERMFIGLFKEN